MSAMAPHGDQLFMGVSNLDERLKMIAYAVQLGLRDPWSREWVLSIVNGCPHANTPGASDCEVRTLFARFKKLRYQYHPRGTDIIQTLHQSIDMGAWDCDQACVAWMTALHILGYKTAAVVMSSDGEVVDHIWPQVGLPRNNPTSWLDLEMTTGPDGTPYSATIGYSVPYAARKWWQRHVMTF